MKSNSNKMSQFGLYAFLTFVLIYPTLGHANIQLEETSEKSYSTSVLAMLDLLDVEVILVEIFESYANQLEIKLSTVRLALQEMHDRLNASNADPETYLSNPVNSFKLMRHMQSDWQAWQLFMEEPVGGEELKTLLDYKEMLPTEIDLKEAITAMQRIESMYNLKPRDITIGLLNGIQYDAQLTSLDCYVIALDYTHKELYFEAIPWLESALEHFDVENSSLYKVMGVTRELIYQLYVSTLLKLKRQANAFKAIDEALIYSPQDSELLKLKSEISLQMETDPVQPLIKPVPHIDIENEIFTEGCLGKLPFPTNPTLFCRYNTTTTPFLKLAPLKMEELSHDPYIVLYHDVLYDREITYFKRHSRGYMQRAITFDVESQNASTDESRTTHSTLFIPNNSSIFDNVNERIVDMTGLSISSSANLNVMNYGIGGHYDLHYDSFNKFDLPDMDGDRIATVLFYFNEVEQGGATVLPQVQLSVKPKKGLALYWTNLHNSGVRDTNTLHGACPVLVGSKWIMTKWIAAGPQIYISPCIEQYEEINNIA